MYDLITAPVSLAHYLALGAILFCVGIAGILMQKRNIIAVLMSIELMLMSANVNFVAFSAYNHDIRGQIASIIVLTIAAAESAIALAIMVAFYRKASSIDLDNVNKLQG